MQEKGWRIGAENSGHVILLDKTTTGDGIVAGLQVLTAMVRNHMSLHDLCSGMKLLPQILVNVRFSGEHNPLKSDEVEEVTRQVEKNWVVVAGFYYVNRVLNHSFASWLKVMRKNH